MWRQSVYASSRTVAFRPAAASSSVFMVAPARVGATSPYLRYYSNKVEAEEFESDISPELLQKFEDAKVTPALKNKVITAPAHLPGKAGVLAMRLFENASAFNQLEQVGNDLNKLRRLALKNEDFDNFLRDKSFQKAQQHQVFGSLLGKSPRVLQRFFAFNVVEDANVSRLLKLVDNYNELLSIHKKEVDVTITVAKPLAGKQLEKLKAKVLTHLPAGSNPNWKIEVKPEIIGGVIVDAGDFYNSDESVASKQADLKRRVDLILSRVRSRIGTEIPEDVPKVPQSQIDEVLKRSVPLPTAEEQAARRKAIADAKKATTEQQQEAFKRNFVDWV